jgi:hypothetical protein
MRLIQRDSHLLEGLLGNWSFNDNYLDKIGTNHGVETGSVPFVTGKMNSGIDFSNNNANYLTLGSALTELTGTTEFSTSCWVKFKTIANLTRMYGPWDYFVNGVFSLTQAYAAPDNYGIYFFILNGSGDAGGNVTYTNVLLSTNTWYNITAVYDGTQPTNITKAKIYINGINQTAGSLGTIVSTTGTSVPITVGKIGSPDPAPANCVLDEIAVWNRTLSEHEIKRLYNGGNGFKLL